MVTQFREKKILKEIYPSIAKGISIFSVGLFKKIFLADRLDLIASPIFSKAIGSNFSILSFSEAWIGSLSYTLQLYFDFSGYSDMALGLSLMLGINLPLNFNSPYKASNMIEFWKRWHMSLSNFLKDYLYIPLGGNRKGKSRHYLNLFVTMLLGGIWHGAGLNFLLWGALHDTYVIINHLWLHFKPTYKSQYQYIPPTIRIIFSRTITFLAVIVGWILFRCDSLAQASIFYRSMCQCSVSHLQEMIVLILRQYPCIFLSLLIVFFMPNSNEMTQSSHPLRFPKIMQWKPNFLWIFITTILVTSSIFFIKKLSPFLYFQF